MKEHKFGLPFDPLGSTLTPSKVLVKDQRGVAMIANDWFDNFSTGDEALDSERRDLFDMLDVCSRDAAKPPRRVVDLRVSVESIGARMLDHVDHLDARMDGADAAMRAKHARARDDLHRLINNFRTVAIEQPERFDMADFADQMRQWLRAQVLTAHLALDPELSAVVSAA
jgi:hemerythrin